MNLVRYILGTSQEWSSETELTAGIVLFNSKSPIPTFQPVILPKKSFEKSMAGSNVRVVVPLPTMNGTDSRYRTDVPIKHIIGVDPKCLLENRRIVKVNEFDWDKLPRIKQCIKDEAAITVVMEDLKNARKFIKKLYLFKKEHKYTALLKHISGTISPPSYNDKLIVIINIYDLPFALPIYNKRKADGLAVTINFAWEKYSQNTGNIKYTDEIHFIVAKDPTNIHFVDGQKTFASRFPGSDYINHLDGRLRKEISRRQEVERCPLKKKLRQKKSQELKAVRGNTPVWTLPSKEMLQYIENAISDYSISTSSTSSNYIG